MKTIDKTYHIWYDHDIDKWEINYHRLVKEDISKLPVKLRAKYYSLTDRMVTTQQPLTY